MLAVFFLLLMLEIPLFSSCSTGLMNHPQGFFQNPEDKEWKNKIKQEAKPNGQMLTETLGSSASVLNSNEIYDSRGVVQSSLMVC